MAGIINASFIIPIRHIKNVKQDTVWLLHSLVGFTVIPWFLLWLFYKDSFSVYITLSYIAWLVILIGGLIFGIGQVSFAYAINRLGIGLSFFINLSVGILLGTFFVLIYKKQLLTSFGLEVVIATILTIISLLLSYFAKKNSGYETHLRENKHYLLGWKAGLLAGFASGCQNITFYSVSFIIPHHYSYGNSDYWIWPPFLTIAAISMYIGFMVRLRLIPELSVRKELREFICCSNIARLAIMGLCFTSSLLLYSVGLNLLPVQANAIAWPIFMTMIVLTSQGWGIFFKELQKVKRIKIVFIIISVVLLLISITILSKQS